MEYKYSLKTFLFLFLFSFNIYAQVGIGNINPDPSSLLDIRDDVNPNKGVLLPQVDIPNLTLAAPIVSPAESLLVYNTNTTTGPGYVYWNGTGWQSFGSSSVSLVHEYTSFPSKSIGDASGTPVVPIVLYTHTISVAKPTLVEINVLISVNISRYDFDAVVSGKPILYGILVTDGPLMSPSSEIIISEFKSYTSGLGGSTIQGLLNLEGSGYIELAAGTHVINMYGAGKGGGSGGYRIVFSKLQGAYFKVIYHN